MNTLRTQGGGMLGHQRTDERGMPLPEFAVPNARTGPLDKDANIAQDDCSTSENPCPADARRPPACEIHVQGAIRVCDLFDRPAGALVLVHEGRELPADPGHRSTGSRARYRGRVNFLSIDVRDDPADVRKHRHGARLDDAGRL